MKPIQIISLVFTSVGIIFVATGDITNGLLACIVGELIDINTNTTKK